MPPSSQERVPQLLEVDLGAVRAPGPVDVAPGPWTSPERPLQDIGNRSGPALGMARFLEGSLPPPAMILCVGEAVRRGLPTAARASILAPSPLTARLSEGQVGSQLGRRLVSVVDALVLRGVTALEGAVLHVGPGGLVELLSMPELVGMDPVRTLERVEARLGPCSVLRCGPAGERLVPFANLAAGGMNPSFVGRGGLGAAFGATGLKAVAISAPPVPGAEDETLTRALLASPRLRARSAGGTLELAHAFGARGDLRERGYSRQVEAQVGAELAQDAMDSGKERHGCKGCPTPCGWVFERGDGRRQGAHFSAVYALGTNLGLPGLDDALRLLEVCDRLGLDAKEAGACLALYAHGIEDGVIEGDPVFGDVEALTGLLEGLANRSGSGALLSDGAEAFARAHGLEAHAFHAGGQAARPESSLAAVLGQCVSARGAEPMRTFPFLLGDGAQRPRIEALLAPFVLPDHAHEPGHPAGKGRLVWWHENLVAALDVTGFCAFSAAGLLADGILDLAQLAAVLSIDGAKEGEPQEPEISLLEMGAQLIHLHHLWNERAGVARDDRPEWAARELALEGMLDEYRAWRGLDGNGNQTARARAAWGKLSGELERVATGATAAGRTGGPIPEAGGAGSPISVRLSGWGPLQRSLPGSSAVILPAPATVAQALHAGSLAFPDAAPWLWGAGGPVPVVYRRGERLEPGDPVCDGDALELVVAVSGGST